MTWDGWLTAIIASLDKMVRRGRSRFTCAAMSVQAS